MQKKSRRLYQRNDHPAAAASPPGDPADKAVALCEEWLVRHAEHEQLIACWQKLETELLSRPDWGRLNEQRRARLPQAAEMEALHSRINDLYDANQKELAALLDIAATSLKGVLCKLAVAAAVVMPDENEEGHLLIQSILRDAASGVLAGQT